METFLKWYLIAAGLVAFLILMKAWLADKEWQCKCCGDRYALRDDEEGPEAGLCENCSWSCNDAYPTSNSIK